MVNVRVAGVTVGGGTHVVRAHGAFMASVAIGTFMGPDKGQSGGVVVAAHPRPVHPSIRGVTILTDRTQPATMNVLMAVYT